MNTERHNYDLQFMNYADRSSRHSAQTISRLLRKTLTIDSALDIGCARGTWLSAWQDAGVGEILGVDGDYVDASNLAISRERFVTADLALHLDLQRKFDLVQSLEVAEHIPEASADEFVGNLVRHSKGIILFSAAPPGQGGEFHVNEQPYEYWRRKFQMFGYEPYDYVRPLINIDTAISFWYRYNVILYAHTDRFSSLPEGVRAARIPPQTGIPDVTPRWFRLRKRLTRLLPFTISQQLARAMARWRGR